MIATAVFSIDPDADVRADFGENPVNYIKSVDNYIIRYVRCLSCCFILEFLLQVAKRLSRIQREAREDWRWFTI
jgi:hypothetical protein